MEKILSIHSKALLYQLQAHRNNTEDNHEKWKIAIIGGAGAVGAYFAKQLVEAGHTVSIITRKNSPSLTNIETVGLRLFANDKELTFPKTKFNYVGDFENFRKIKQELVIISLKQPDMSAEVASQILEITNPDSIIGSIANGLPFYFLQGLGLKKQYLESVDPKGHIMMQLRARKIIGIQPVIAARVLEPAKIQILRALDSITVVLGTVDTTPPERIKSLRAMFNDAGIKTTLAETDLRKNILEKLQFALSTNSLSAITERNLGEVFEDPKTQVLIRYSILLTNTISIALNLGPLRNHEQFKSIKLTKTHFSSLYHDIKAGKQGKIEAMIDAPIELVELLRVSRTHNAAFPSLEPLKILKDLLIFASQRDRISQEKLLPLLFEACDRALFPCSMRLRARL